MFILQAEETPLHIAARIKDGEKVAEMLIKSGADVNVSSDVRKSLLVYLHAQTKRHILLLKLLNYVFLHRMERPLST